MPDHVSFSRMIPVARNVDVAVAGGGPAGCAAAIAAGRAGASVVLIEGAGIVGGMATMGLVQPISSLRTLRGDLFPGVGSELVRRLHLLAEDWIEETPSEAGVATHHEGISAQPEALVHVWLGLLRDAGVDVWLHTALLHATGADGRVEALIVHNKSGLLAIRPACVVDATGDGDVIAALGLPVRKGRETDGALQPASIMFVLDQVDYAQAAAWINRPIRFEDLGLTADDVTALIPPDLLDFSVPPGHLPLPQGRVLFFKMPQGQVVVNMTRLCGIDGTRGADVSRGEVDGRRQMMVLVTLLRKYVPGFAQARLVRAAPTLGVRQTRTVVGAYTMVREDVVSDRRFADAVAFGSYPIDIHNPTGKGVEWQVPDRSHYEVPYGALTPAGGRNVLAAGRCVSADHDALSSVRIQGTAIATGQAAGTAAALAALRGHRVGEIPAADIRAALAAHFDFSNWRWGQPV